MITLTTSAQARIEKVLAEEGPAAKLRMFVQGGGCSGFNYGFTIDDTVNEDDFEIPANTATVLVDTISAQYLQGAVVDFLEDLEGSRFSISNPQAQTTCGCGSSFNPY